MISLAGQDYTDAWLSAFREQQSGMLKTGRFLRGPAATSALRVASARSSAEALQIWINLLPYREHVGLETFDIPARPGWRGRLTRGLRSVLWRLLRYQHERICFRQNLVNSHLVAALAFERAHFSEEIAKLQARIDAIESERLLRPSA